MLSQAAKTLTLQIILFFVMMGVKILCSYLDSSYSYSYKSPVYAVKNPNITFAMAGPTKKNSYNDLVYGNMFAAVCQADKINQGIGGVNFRGNINLMVQEFTTDDISGQQATQSMFKNNLYNNTSNEAVYGNKSLPLGGFFGFSGTGTLRINSAISNGFLFPFVFAGTETSQDPDNLFVGHYASDNTTNYQIRDTLVYNSFNAILDVLNYFNWTLVGTIFESNSYGYNMQELVQTYQSKAFSPNFACSVLFSPDISLNSNGTFDSYYKDFCGCIGDKDTISVVVIWTTTSSAAEIIRSLQSACPESKKWTFIITNDVAFDLNDNLAAEVLQNSLVLRQFGSWDFDGFMKECLETASPAAEPILDQLSSELYAKTYSCIKYKDEGDNFAEKLCPENVNERSSNSTVTCLCTGNEVKDDSFASNFFFSADAVTLYGEAMSLLQNNCTFLNENLGWDDEENNMKKDYCAMTTFEPSDLTDVMQLVNFYGYTGPIRFGSKILKRLIKTFYMYSLPYGISTSVLVGVLSVGSVQN